MPKADYVVVMMKLMPPYKKGPKVAVIRLHGVIGGASRLSGNVLNDVSSAPLIERAFAKGKPKAIALSVNSPGGSPVQSSLIASRIRRLADEQKIPVYGFCEDVAASGGYWLATAADQIFVDRSSIIGSIGVISASFGLDAFIARHGIERRVHTAGENKSMLDPFRPEREADVERLKNLQSVIHENFIQQVMQSRGSRLKRTDVFTGEIWAGEAAVDLGLVDGIGHLVPKMKELYGDDVKFSVTQPRRSLFQRIGAPGVHDFWSAVEDRLAWARFGQ